MAWILGNVFHTWAAACIKCRHFAWNPEESQCYACLKSATHPFLCPFPLWRRNEAVDWCVLLSCADMDFWFWSVWKQVLPLHFLCSSCFLCHCSQAGLFVSDTCPLPLSVHLGWGCQSVLSKEIWVDLCFTTFHFLQLLLCLLVTEKMHYFQTLGIASCKGKVTSTALVFI